MSIRKRGYGSAHNRLGSSSAGASSLAGQAESVLLQMVRGQAPDALDIESPIEGRIHPLKQKARPPTLPVDQEQEDVEDYHGEVSLVQETPDNKPIKKFLNSHHHVKYKALTDLTKAFLVSLFIRLDTNNNWKKVSAMQRAIQVWRCFTEQENHRLARRQWDLDFARMKLRMDEKLRHSEERNKMLSAEKEGMRLEYEGYIDSMRRAHHVMNMVNPIARKQQLQGGWIKWQSLVLVKKLEEEQVALHLASVAAADKEAKERAECLAMMNTESIKAIHKLQHLFVLQDKRLTRLRAVKYFFAWHIKAMVARYKAAYVQTVDPLRAHIRYQERLLQRVEDDVQHELGKRASPFKPALMSTGIGGRNALRVAAVRLSKAGEGRGWGGRAGGSAETIHSKDAYMYKYGGDDSQRGRCPRTQYGATSKHRHPYPAEDARQKKAAVTLPSYYITPVSRKKSIDIQKEQLASATTRGGEGEGEEKRTEGSIPVHVGEHEADLYYGFDEVAREYGLLELEHLDEGEEGVGLGNNDTPGPGDNRDTDGWGRQKERLYVESAAALDLYDSVVHPRTYAEKQTRARIVEAEKKKRIRALKGLLSRQLGNGSCERDERSQRRRLRQRQRSAALLESERERKRGLSGSYTFTDSAAIAAASAADVTPSGALSGTGKGRNVQVAISSPVRINDFSVSLDLNLDEVDDRSSICSMDTDDYNAYNNDVLDTIAWRGR